MSSLLATSRALSDRYNVTLVTWDDVVAHHDPFVASGIPVVVAGRRMGAAARHLVAGADLVTIEGAWNRMGPAVAAECRRTATPYAYVPHGSLSGLVRRQYPGLHLKKFAYWLLVERRVAVAASRGWYSSEAERRRSQGTFPGMPRDWRVIPFASREVSGPTTRTPAAGRPLHLVTAARVMPVKDLDIAIRALASPGSTWHLTIAGNEDPGHVAELRQLADDLGVSDRISWLGFLDTEELDELYRRSDAYICPGLESFGMSVAEALSANLPVIASDAVALAPVIRDAGAVFPRGDVDTLVRAIEEVAARINADDIGDSPVEVWREHCSPENFLRAFSAAMDPVLG